MYCGNERKIGDKGAKSVTSIRGLRSQISIGRNDFQTSNRAGYDFLNMSYMQISFMFNLFIPFQHTINGVTFLFELQPGISVSYLLAKLALHYHHLYIRLTRFLPCIA